MFCGLAYSPGIYPFHVPEIDQCPQNGFNSCTSNFADLFGIRRLHFNMHAIVIRFINAVIEHFKVTLTYATAA